MADKKDVQDTEHVEDGFEKLLEDAARRDRLYRELRDVPKLFRPAPSPEEPEEVELPPSPERPLAGTSLEQLLNHGKKCKVCSPALLPEHRESPSPEHPLAGTSLEQLLNYGKKRVDAQP